MVTKIRALTPKEILASFAQAITDQCGDLGVAIKDFATPTTARAGSMTFANNEKLMSRAEASPACCVLAPIKFKGLVEQWQSQKCWLFCQNVDLVAREIKQRWFFATPYRPPYRGVHPSAIIAENVELGRDCVIGAHAFIGAGCRLGDNCFVGANAVIEENSSIGENTTIHPLAYIGHSTQIGKDCEIMPNATIASEGFGYAHDHQGQHHRIPHTGRVIIEDRVHIGAGSTIDRGTIEDSRIGTGTIIDNQVHFGHNVIVGKNCIFVSNVVIAGSTTIGDNFVCGGNTAITGHISVCDNVQVGGMSGVHNSIDKPGQYTGYPLEPLKQSLKNKASYVHLHEMRRQLNKLYKKVFPPNEA